MSNGFSDKEMIELILKGQQGIQSQIALLGDNIDEIKCNGCSKREDDIRRLGDLESWRNKGIAGIIAALLTSLGATLSVIFSGK